MQSSREMLFCWFSRRVMFIMSTNFEVPSDSPQFEQIVVRILRFRLHEAGDVLVRSRRIARISVGRCCWLRTICMFRVSFRCCSICVMYVSIGVELRCLFAM